MRGRGRDRRNTATGRVGGLGARSLLLASAGALVACTAILGIEEAELIEGAGASGAGGSGGCQSAADCDDDNRCTYNDCNLDTHECTFEAVPDGPAPPELQIDGDCQRVTCAAGDPSTEPDDSDLPVDGNQCTEDVCTMGTPSNPAAQNGAECDQNEGVLCYQTECVECYNNSHCALPDTCGGGGTPLECGCTPEACDELTCGFAYDDKCNTTTLDCNDGLQNGDETDVDCGGPTVAQNGSCDLRCQAGDRCLIGGDCASANCVDCGGFSQCDTCGAGGSGGGGGGGGGS
jgi:hypothetical protein